MSTGCGRREKWSGTRQLSLEGAGPRAPLRKHNSEVSCEPAKLWQARGGGVRPRGVRVAWARSGSREERASWPAEPGVTATGLEPPAPVQLVAKRLVTQPRPPRPPKSPLLPDNNTLLMSRHQLTERLRQAWRQTRSTKLDIFINSADREQSPRESFPVTPTTAVQETSPTVLSRQNVLDISIENLEPVDCEKENAVGEGSESGSDFNEDAHYGSGTPTDEEVAQAAEVAAPPETSEHKKTAGVRRLNFKKSSRSRLAFSTSTPPETPVPKGQPKRPLPRLMSAPPRQQNQQRPLLRNNSAQLKHFAHRRTIKSAPPKRKSARNRASSDEDDAEGARTDRGSRRGRAEVVTMVSLVSPSQSDVESEVAPPILRIPQTPSPSTTPPHIVTHNPPPPPIINLRRPPPKIVSFKPISSSGVPYAANFPCRRGGAAPSLHRTGGVTQQAHPTIVLNRRPPPPKPPLLASLRITPKLIEQLPSPTDDEVKTTGEEADQNGPTSTAENNTEVQDPVGRSNDGATHEEEKIELDPPFEDPKEKECWKLFKRMADKGVAISFETVLRGMLTPTEYRLRKASLMARW